MKILAIDDHVLIREALRGVIKELDDDALILEASNCCQSMQLIEQHPDLDLVLLDLNLPDRDGFSMLAEVRERYPAIAVVVLSASNGHRDVTRALALGALGYIPKTTEREVLLSALRLVFSGGIFIPTEILHRNEPSPQYPVLRSSAAESARVSAADLGLTERQIDVLTILMQGKSNKSIGRILNLAEPTVKNHVTAILKVLKVSSRTEAVIKVRAGGLEL
jgi:DNA-binding NarL/FixJ family response regulator